jgi:hypothetical protein
VSLPLPSNTLLHLMGHVTVVPVVIVATKFDLVVSQALFDIARGDNQFYEQARTVAHEKYDQSCRSLFPRKTRVVPVEAVSSTLYFHLCGFKGNLTHSTAYSENKIWGSHRQAGHDNAQAGHSGPQQCHTLRLPPDSPCSFCLVYCAEGQS